MFKELSCWHVYVFQHTKACREHFDISIGQLGAKKPVTNEPPKKANLCHSESNSSVCYHKVSKRSSMFKTSRGRSKTFSRSERVAQLIIVV